MISATSCAAWAKHVGNKGQACVEAIYTVGPNFLILLFIVFSNYSFLLKSWVDHCSYEATVCLITYPNTPSQCRSKLNKQLKSLWPLGKLNFSYKKDHLIKTFGHFSFTRLWQINFSQKIVL